MTSTVIYLLVAIALPNEPNAVYCKHRRCDLKYFPSRTDCEIAAINEPALPKVLLRCLPVHRRQDPF